MFVGYLLAAVVSTAAPQPAVAAGVVAAVNAERARSGLPALVADPTLQAVAVERARDMIRRHYFAHRAPGGRTAFDDLRARAYAFRIVGENIALATSVGQAERALWRSAEHRQNLLERGFRRIGVAVVLAAGEEYVVQLFAG